MSKKGVSEIVSAVILISVVIAMSVAFSYVYTHFLYEQKDRIEGTVFEELGLEGCSPDYECTQWSECIIDYNINDLLEEEIGITGISKRTCTDTTNCAPQKTEEQACSAKQQITVNLLEEDGNQYLEIIDKNGNLISKINKNEESGTLYIELFA